MAISKVVVVDGNNLTVRIDRGVAGRGITDVQPIEIDNALYLEFFFSDGTTETVGPVGTIQYIGQSPIVVDAATISLSTVPVTLGGTNATTAAGARTNLNAANQDTTISAGTGLSGGGSLAANRTISIANTAVTAGSYGAASKTLTATVNAQGQLTSLAEAPIAIANTQISGLGTMSTQNANAVDITGGSITGITDLAIADGGTGASTAADARTNLNAANQDTTISAGTGLSGGGSLAGNRTLSIANTGVTAGSFGSASNTLSATVNAQGQLTSLAATPIAIANTQVSGLGTASTLNAGVANGVATLDAGGTVPLSQIPASIQGGVSYQGSWNAATNTPTIVSGVGSKGHYYVVSVAGSTNIDGITDWLPGDWIIFNGSVWEQIDNTDTVQSVNGYVGAVVLTAADVGAPPTTRTITAGTGLSGGGDLSANRTINIANTAVTAGSYGTASSVPSITVNAQGQLTAASNTTIAITNTQVSGLGTMSTQNANSVAITGGAIDGTAIGGTTAAAASVTTLTTSSTVTHNGGTANGVAYLNGSKVLTTGSALTFDGNQLAIKSGGTFQPLKVSGYGGSIDTYFYVDTAYWAYGDATGLGGNAFGGNKTSNYLFWQINGSEQMRLTSTGLGIGTSSPAYKLDISGAGSGETYQIRVGASNSNTAFTYNLGRSTVDGYFRFYGNQTGYTGYIFGGVDGERMRLDSSGNLGIGTSSPSYKLDVAGTAANTISGVRDTTGYALFRAANSSNLTFLGADSSTGAVSGTANATLVWGNSNVPMLFATNGSVKATLDAVGNLGLGVTPSAWAVRALQGPASFSIGNAGDSGMNLLSNAYYGTGWTYIASAAASWYQQLSGAHKWYTAPSGTAGNAISFTQAMTLDASGNLGVGTTTPSLPGASRNFSVVATSGADAIIEVREPTSGSYGRLYQQNPYSYLLASTAWLFYTNGSERARIDSSGNLLVGTTSQITSGKLCLQYNGVNFNGIVTDDTYTTGTTYSNVFRKDGSTVGTIAQTTVSTAYNTSSDYRLKENIQPMTGALAKVAALKPCTYKWKADGSDGEGFIAHELAEVVPQCVTGEKDAVDADGKPVYQGIDTSFLVATLTAAIQELKAEFDAYKSTHP